ncbi:hypothetical protein H4W26_000467 [Nesterenkonia halotolerans]|uniref:Uncharacterized protein n=1 Tax=Nesterenkonia halotolerans TaxID=225325 RepID=A0ABR9J3Z4_9MICC|nr:hypothetical protein [Nesterenkonia halotolerans]
MSDMHHPTGREVRTHAVDVSDSRPVHSDRSR